MQDKQQTIKQVVGLGKIKDIVAGSCHSIAISDNGIWTWGKSQFCNLGIKTSQTVIYQPVFLQIPVTKACAGNEHTFAWKNNEVYCWGSNKDYKLGLPDPKQYALTKSQIFVQAIDAGMQLSNISCGDSHSLAVFKLEEQQQISFQIFAWGQSRSYQLGLQAEGAVDEPILVEFNQSVQNILSRSDYNLILTQTGDCYSWGTNLFGRLGFANQIKNQKLPTKIKSLVNIKSVSMGKYHCIAISQNMQCFSWGHGLYGQLGLNQIVSQTTPTKVQLRQKIIQSACGEYHSILVTENGQMMSCGTNSYMALGHCLIDNKKRCKKFEKIETHNKKIIKVVCGYRHNLMLTSDGSVYSWGCNKYGQLGITNSKQANKEVSIQFHRNALLRPDQKKEQRQQQQPVGKSNEQQKSSSMEKCQKQKLESWRIRYQNFRLQKEEQQKQFMKQLNQILSSNFYK